jgi:opacity protein-like surface antigen
MLVNFSVHAQRKTPYLTIYQHTHFGSFSYSAGFSLSAYSGDLSAPFNAKLQRFYLNPSIYAGVNYQITEYLRARAEVAYVMLHSKTKEGNWGNRSFSGNNFTFNVLVQHSLFSQSSVDAVKIRWNPYIYLGLGVVSFHPKSKAEIPVQMPEYSKLAFTIPMGVGVEYSFNDFIKLGAEIRYHPTTTDYLDDTSREDAPNQKNDSFYVYGVKGVFRFNQRYSYKRWQKKSAFSTKKR